MSVQALILCGGKGKRLRPLTENIPKPLAKIKKKTILGHIIEHIITYGIKDLIFATGYQSEKVKEYLETSCHDCNYSIIDSGDVDIVQRIKDAVPYITGDLILLYGDTLSDVDINDLIKFHHSHSGKATMTVWPLRSPFGVLEVDQEGMISSYQEKPILDKWINIGYFYLEPEALQLLAGCDSFENYLTRVIEKREMNGYKHRGAHITVNTLEELQAAEDNIDKIYGYNILGKNND
ncbi:MAG: sugar phosphate nucleotidyltransferase [Pseudomonadota bacterium]